MHNVGVIFAGEIIKNSFQNALEPILKIKVMIPGFFGGSEIMDICLPCGRGRRELLQLFFEIPYKKIHYKYLKFPQNLITKLFSQETTVFTEKMQFKKIYKKRLFC